MKEIKLTQGKIALVDDEDYQNLNQFKWHATIGRTGGFYAARKININGFWHTQRMHRLIMNTPKEFEVDHKDHNGLNNQKSNLRNCTRSQNNANNKAWCKSKYKGVYYSRKCISARISINGKYLWLGSFKTEIEAAKAFDKAAKRHYGEFANLNIK